jgi:hypothetical protein
MLMTHEKIGVFVNMNPVQSDMPYNCWCRPFWLVMTHSGKETLQCDMPPCAIIPVTSNTEQEIVGMELIN